MFKKLISFFFTLFFVINVANAQVTTSGMSGTVTDVNGEPLTGATVIAHYQPTGAQYGTVVDLKGNFRLYNINAGGPYTVTIQMLGYTTVKYENISVALADNYVVNVVLKEESIALDAIVVTGSSSSNMRSDRAGALTNLNVAAINNTPTISRSMNDLIRLTPQAHMSSNGANIGGGNYRQSFVTVDGAAFNNAFGIGQNLPASGSPVSLDALEQISINVTPYDVRQSGFTGASINAVTRSGDNEFRASVYTYLNNEKFKGNHVGDEKFIKSESDYQVIGARFGGPIIKDKLFFFVSYEQEKSTEPGPVNVAATAENPYTNGSNGVARPTVAQLDGIKSHLISQYGYDPGVYQGYSAESPGHKLLARIDWNITKDHKFNIRYTDTKAKNPSSPSTSTSGLGDRNFTGNSRTYHTALYFQNARYYQETNFRSVAGELNSRFLKGRLNNILRASYSHQDEPRSTDGNPFPFVDIAQDGNTLTSFGTELFSFGNLRDVETLNITDEVSFSYNNHNFFAGVQYEHNVTKNGFQRFGAGYYQYNSIEDFYNDNANQFAITHSTKSDFSQNFPSFDFNQISFYLQDEISFGHNFKLLGGIRFELPMYPSLDSYNEQVANTSLGAGNYNNPDLLKKYNTTELPKTRLMVSPRLGFNYDILGNRSFIVRGGTGVFTGRVPFVWIVSQSGDSGVLQQTYTATASKGGIIPSLTADRMDMLNQIYPDGFSASASKISSVSLMDRDLKMPQTWKSSLAFDASLPYGIKASLEGIYNKDINPAIVRNIGLKQGIATNIPDYNDNRLFWGENHDSTLKNAYLLTNAEKAGYYYSLTASLAKTFDFGLDASISYTHSGAKNVKDGIGDQIASAWNTGYTVNGNNMEEYGYASYVMPHRIIASLNYRKEYIKKLATSVSLVYEGGPSNRVSYTYTSCVVGDGGAYNLIYVPKSADELEFSDYTYKNSAGETVNYTAEAQSADFWNFVNGNKHLKSRKGDYAERNGQVGPWTHRFDLKISQDLFTNICGKRNTIQVGLDIKNIGNLLNKNWGHVYSSTPTAILKQTNKLSQGGTVKPVYQFQRNGTEVLSKDFYKTLGFASTYSMQVSVRYIFN